MRYIPHNFLSDSAENTVCISVFLMLPMLSYRLRKHTMGRCFLQFYWTSWIEKCCHHIVRKYHLSYYMLMMFNKLHRPNHALSLSGNNLYNSSEYTIAR